MCMYSLDTICYTTIEREGKYAEHHTRQGSQGGTRSKPDERVVIVAFPSAQTPGTVQRHQSPTMVATCPAQRQKWKASERNIAQGKDTEVEPAASQTTAPSVCSHFGASNFDSSNFGSQICSTVLWIVAH